MTPRLAELDETPLEAARSAVAAARRLADAAAARVDALRGARRRRDVGSCNAAQRDLVAALAVLGVAEQREREALARRGGGVERDGAPAAEDDDDD